MQKGAVGVLILIAILVVGLGVIGAWYMKIIQIPNLPPPGCRYQKVQCIQAPCNPILTCGTVSSNPMATSQATPSPASSVSPAPTGVGDNPVPNGTGETADWKTYTSKQIPITFQYPPIVEATKLGGPGDRIPSGGYEFKEGGVMIRPLTSKYEIYLRITTLANSSDSSYEWVRIDQLYNVSVGESPKAGLTEFVRKQDIVLSNITAHFYENERSKYPTSISRLIVFKKIDSYYTIETTYSLMTDSEEKTKYLKIFDQILSTFKLLN